MRNIDWEKPLSPDDKLWLEQRLTPELVNKIEDNERRFGGGKSSVEAEEAPGFEDDYDKW